MSSAGARRLAWSLASLAALLMVGGRIVYVASGEAELIVREQLLSAITIAFAVVGALVASRHRRNPIGWIFLAIAMTTGFYSVADGYLKLRLDEPDPGALAGAAAVYCELIWLSFVIVPATFLLLLFPDGRLLSRRWRPIAWCAGAGTTMTYFVFSATPDLLSGPSAVDNPFAVDSTLIGPLTGLSVLVMYIGIFGSVASIVRRFRHAGRAQRQQIKWLATAGALLAVIAPLDAIFERQLGAGAFAATTIAVLGLPAAVGIAILRHRLYDIDVVINRTLVYAALTATLAATYLGAVLLLQVALSPLTASSNLAIAGSTLAVAALFQPARRRIQALVDRRFYRSKYDAARTLERFGARLRDEIALDTLSDELRAVVSETMQPAHVTLWLRAPGAQR
jgi:hypothetical protein